ncbi:unnamed protein product [Camellia sinensis]
MATHIIRSLSFQANTSSKARFDFDSKSQFSLSFRGLGKPRRGVSVSIRAMGSSASSQKPDNIQEAGRVSISDEELKKRLTGEQYYITRQKGTERAFTG